MRAEREDADVEDDREIGENDDRRNQRALTIVEMRRPGEARQQPHQQRHREAVGAVVGQTGKEAEHERPGVRHNQRS